MPTEIAAPGTSQPATGGASAKAASALSSDFETFLRMLTAQMENQDPLNPIESADFAVQLATFSGVEQQVRTNSLLESLAGSLGLSQLAGWVGMEVRAPVAAQFSGSPIELAPTADDNADRALLIARDAEGNVATRQEISPDDTSLVWAGTSEDGAPLPPGLYSFSLESYRGDELLTTEPVDAYVTVVEAQARDGTTTLITRGGITVDSASVSAVRAGSG
ncbi:MAG: flagellar hook capping FlgD N-terminal domain-containing protein [Paracoccaceae bacterium]